MCVRVSKGPNTAARVLTWASGSCLALHTAPIKNRTSRELGLAHTRTHTHPYTGRWTQSDVCHTHTHTVTSLSRVPWLTVEAVNRAGFSLMSTHRARCKNASHVFTGSSLDRSFFFGGWRGGLSVNGSRTVNLPSPQHTHTHKALWSAVDGVTCFALQH